MMNNWDTQINTKNHDGKMAKHVIIPYVYDILHTSDEATQGKDIE